MAALRVLITGCEGFIGSYLADFLVVRGHRCYGMTYGGTSLLRHLQGRMDLIACDLKDRARVEAVIRETTPDLVFHLAAQSFVTVSWEDPRETLETNALGSFHLLEAIRGAAVHPRIVVVGSSAMYGFHDTDEMPLREDAALRPTSMYAVSKVAEDMLGYFYWRAYGMHIVRVRPFNMTGPRKVADACSDFAQEIAECERGLRRVIEVGNLDTVRDFTDGRDAVRALWLLAERGVPGDAYNLCTGRGCKTRDMLERLIAISGRPLQYAVSPARLRPFDDPIYVGDNAKIAALGWTPQISTEQMLRDALEYWRERLVAAAG